MDISPPGAIYENLSSFCSIYIQNTLLGDNTFFPFYVEKPQDLADAPD
jgi:hypothetical protein